LKAILNENEATPTPETFHDNAPMAAVPDLSETSALPSMSTMPPMSFEPPPPALEVKLLSSSAKTPTRGSPHAAGYDLYAAKEATVPRRGKVLVDLDISIAVPAGAYGRIAPRSGLASKHSIDTGAGVIDADYRGPVKVLLFNFSDEDFVVAVGERVAQLIVERVSPDDLLIHQYPMAVAKVHQIYTPEIVVVEQLDETVRGAGGFGSTGGFGGTLPSLTNLPTNI
jgi:dUTP pyrophosphatase